MVVLIHESSSRRSASVETPNALVQISCQVTDIRLLPLPATSTRRRAGQLSNASDEREGATEIHMHNATALHAAA